MNYMVLVKTGASAKEIRTRHLHARIGLIRAREDIGLTRPELAEKLGIARSTIFRVETGTINVRLDIMLRWLDALGPRASLDLFRI